MQLALLILCWLILVILHLTKNKCCSNILGMGYTLLHRIHEVTLFYIWTSALLEWLTFNQHSQYKEVSLALSIVGALYFLIYEIYVFYRLIPYPFAEVASKKYAYYVEKYSFFLRDLRFEEYRSLVAWSPRHFLRPYNYQILSFFRLLMILAALPLFSEFTHGPISCLVVIQCLEIIRFSFTWPFFALWRNIYRLVLEVVLLLFFSFYLVNDILITYFFTDINSISQSEVDLYYGFGWAGFGCVFFYNIAFIIYFIIDIIYGCLYTNR